MKNNWFPLARKSASLARMKDLAQNTFPMSEKQTKQWLTLAGESVLTNQNAGLVYK